MKKIEQKKFFKFNEYINKKLLNLEKEQEKIIKGHNKTTKNTAKKSKKDTVQENSKIINNKTEEKFFQKNNNNKNNDTKNNVLSNKHKNIKKRSSIQIFFAVINALMLREIITRFGEKKIGYFWAIMEPLASVLVFILIKELIHPTAYSNINYPLFLVTGIVAYNMFKNITLRSMEAFIANKALFLYKQVKPFDTLISRFIIEFFLAILVLIVFYIIGIYLGIEIKIKNLLGVMIGYILIGLFGLSLGILFSVLNYLNDNIKKTVNILFTPLYFASGLFYTVSDLPDSVQKYILYNPIIHYMEFIHGNCCYSLNLQYVNYNYIILSILIPMFIGLLLYKKYERRIIMS